MVCQPAKTKTYRPQHPRYFNSATLPGRVPGKHFGNLQRELRKFSQRIGARQPPKSGLEEASPELRTALWNVLHKPAFPDETEHRERALANARAMWSHIGWRIDQVPLLPHQMRAAIAAEWFSCRWPEFFDLIEFTARLLATPLPPTRQQWFEMLNRVLVSKGCAYRFIAEQLVPLTNTDEATAVATGSESAIPAVAAHIREARRLLPPNTGANPRDSIRESISAVESALRHLTGNANATLTEGLAAFETTHGVLHPSLRQGLVTLCGYSSNGEGARHDPAAEADGASGDDAHLMLVACSAFTNHLVRLSAAKRGN
jgi:AbiJ N-terminal domain 4